MTRPALEMLDVALVRAPNPGPLTLSGTNSWVVGRDPAWVIDPGPALVGHLDALAHAVASRGGAAGVALTHAHADHADGVAALLALLAPRLGLGAHADALAAAVDGPGAAPAARPLADGDAFGPLVAIALPGHAPGHLGFLLETDRGRACFTGDAVLGEGSVFVSADMSGYLAALERLHALELDVLFPGHGPPVTDPGRHLRNYVEHRLARERRLLDALAVGLREEGELLDAAWSDVPPRLREAARRTLRAHLGKLRAEGRSPV